MQPRDADGIAFFQTLHAGTECGDDAGAFVTRNERQRRLHRPVAVGGVEVGVTDAARHDLDEHLAWRRIGHPDLLDGERVAERSNDGRLHGFHDRCSLPEAAQPVYRRSAVESAGLWRCPAGVKVRQSQERGISRSQWGMF